MGRVVQVIGPVVDVAFDSAELPEINTALLLTNKAIDSRTIVFCFCRCQPTKSTGSNR